MKKRKRKPSNGPIRRRKALATMVLDRIVDMMFPNIIPGLANFNTNGRSDQEERSKKRKTATQNVLNWRARSEPWPELVARFGWAVLLLLPEGLSDEK
jgi:hypothetical protein